MTREAVAQARMQRMRGMLQAAFDPVRLEVQDEGHRHVGHAGARDGRGHFRVVVVSDAFADMAPLARHRAVYAALGELMQTDIHALQIDARPPEPAGEDSPPG